MPAKKQRLINLVPKEDFERTTLGRIMKWALTSFRFIVIVVELVVISGFLYRFWLDIRISNLDDEITQKTAIISQQAPFEEEFRRIQAKTQIYKSLTSPANHSLPAFQDIVASLPEDAQLLSFTRKSGGAVEITGATLNENSIAGFMANLGAKPSFASVDLTQISTTEDSPLINFSLKLTTALAAEQPTSF